MKSETTLIRRRLKDGRWYAVDPNGKERPLSDRPAGWSRLDGMTAREIEAAARSDPDAQPLTKKQLKSARRIPFAKHVRWMVGLSQQEFSTRYHIPIGTLRDWEQGRTKLDQAAKAYLTVIARNPELVREALAPAA